LESSSIARSRPWRLARRSLYERIRIHREFSHLKEVHMGLWSRFALLFRSRTSAALDRAEDPRETLDYAYAQQQELLRKVRQGLIEVATSKKQLEHQTRQIESRIPQLEDQARRALAAGREDLARRSLQRRETAATEVTSLRQQVAELAQEEEKLTQTEQALGARIEEFRGRRSMMSARYTAAEAQVRVNEALTGVSGELAELGMALGRAEEKTDRMQARAAALDAFIDPSALNLPGSGDDVEYELRKVASERAVEKRMEALRLELSGGEWPPLIGAG
jgi:phage shock protein A